MESSRFECRYFLYFSLLSTFKDEVLDLIAFEMKKNHIHTRTHLHMQMRL